MPDLLDFVPHEWGAKIGNDFGAATLSKVEPNEIAFKPSTHLALILLTPQPGRETSINSDRKTITRAPIGTVEIFPAHNDIFARWPVRKENLLVAMDPVQMAQIAGMEWQTDTFELQPPKPASVDSKLLFMSTLFQSEILKGPSHNKLYFDSLMVVFSTHILRNYSSLAARPDHHYRGGLSQRTWRSVTDYIQGHLSEDITIADLAAISGLSSSHFLRAFRQFSGQSPHQYLVEQRLAYGEHLIRNTSVPIKEIARLTGFSSASHLTATMRQKHHKTPTALRSGKS